MSDDLLRRLDALGDLPALLVQHSDPELLARHLAEAAAEIRRLREAVEAAKLERDMAREQFDNHVAWASEQADISARAIRSAQALATCCMAPGCYSHDELIEMARATRPTFDAALGRIEGEGR